MDFRRKCWRYDYLILGAALYFYFVLPDRPVLHCLTNLLLTVILMGTNSARGPDMAQPTIAAPAIDLTQRRLARADTMPNPAAGHNDSLLHTSAKRFQTLPAFPQFDPYALNDTPVVTPGSVVKLSPQDDIDPNLSAAASSYREWSWKGHYVCRACIATLRFVQRHWIIVSMLFVFILVSTSIAVGWSLRLSSFQGVQVLDPFLIGEPFWVSGMGFPSMLLECIAS